MLMLRKDIYKRDDARGIKALVQDAGSFFRP